MAFVSLYLWKVSQDAIIFYTHARICPHWIFKGRQIHVGVSVGCDRSK